MVPTADTALKTAGVPILPGLQYYASGSAFRQMQRIL
jgi:hypothetical protein